MTIMCFDNRCANLRLPVGHVEHGPEVGVLMEQVLVECLAKRLCGDIMRINMQTPFYAGPKLACRP